ncbi:histidine phosphatase family protein [Bacillus tianshenii]|uniref:histidine phosphatase family protein n=1 Tax=Sutcliffiella tianshenii TaxID=1463404 RepID=UPI001CD4A68C|nr:histidine phosphatase family protein [Bacillus tianshenii]MCA1322207.1 histidine phosphatase family protein [Bacillus tianshenii]
MIYVIRHGETDLNKEGRIQGRCGLPLNELGVEQALALRDELQHVHFDYIYSSPQERAIQTAELVTGKSAQIDSRLDVYDVGEADGLKKGEVKMDGIVPDRKIYQGIEDMQDYLTRIFDFMHELENQHRDQEVNILLSGHRCTTGCIGAYLKSAPIDNNILAYSSDNGKYKVYAFKE